jgi:Nucleotidyl transferase AbiEii toxin, Type IV TA system
MFPDFIDLIALLNKHKVKYLVIGGYAVSRYAQPRATKDLDILISPAPKNAAAVFRALVEFGAPLRVRTSPDADPEAPAHRLTAKDFQAKDTWYTMGVPPVAIDILPAIPGVAFNAAWKNHSTQIIDEATGLTAHFISREDLIAAKLAAGRVRDLADVDELRRAAAEVTRSVSTPQTPKPRKDRKKNSR